MKNGKEGMKLATQIQVTPTLYGKDAEDVLKQIARKPIKEEKNNLIRNYQNKFKEIKKRGNESE